MPLVTFPPIVEMKHAPQPRPALKLYDPEAPTQVRPQGQVEREYVPRQRMAFRGFDAVNFHEAAVMADKLDLACDQYYPRDDMAKFQGYVLDFVDLDFWASTPEERAVFVKSMTVAPLRRRTIVQSYNLTDEEIETLCRNGVVVARHATLDTFLEALGPAMKSMVS